MSTDFLSRRLFQLGQTVADGKWAQLSSTPSGEFLVVAITAPTVVVLVALLGNVLGLPLAWTLALATTLGLAVVLPSMLKEMPCFTRTETADILCMSQTPPVGDVLSYSGAPDYEGWYGPMVNFNSDELDFLSELVGLYLEENDDLSQREWGFAKGIQDKLEEALDG